MSFPRKRPFSAISSSSYKHNSQLPSDSINPLSHPPSLLQQFAVAGQPIDQALPSATYPAFPHRPLPAPRAASVADDDGADESDDDPEQVRRKDLWDKSRVAVLRRNAQYDQQLGGLIGHVEKGLATGDVARAKRAFGLLVRSKIRGKLVDLRHNELWALGAEVLLREATLPPGAGDDMPVLTEDGMRRVRAYYDGLIRQHPYHKQHPDATSSLHFYRAKFAHEVDFVYRAQRQALQRLEAEGGDDQGMDLDPPGYGAEEYDAQSSAYLDRESSLLPEKNKLRERALGRMHEIAAEMSNVMAKAPFSTDHELLRLRAVAELYMADLSLLPEPRRQRGRSIGESEASKHRKAAMADIGKIVRSGGEVGETWLQDLVKKGVDAQGQGDEEDDEGDADDDVEDIPEIRMFSSRAQ